jgi:hypothetical protein
VVIPQIGTTLQEALKIPIMLKFTLRETGRIHHLIETIERKDHHPGFLEIVVENGVQ